MQPSRWLGGLLGVLLAGIVLVGLCSGSLLKKRGGELLDGHESSYQAKKRLLVRQGSSDCLKNVVGSPFEGAENGTIDVAPAWLLKPLDSLGMRGEGWSWDHLESLLAAQIEGVLAQRLGLKEWRLSKIDFSFDDHGQGAAPPLPDTCSRERLPLPDRHLIESLCQLCERLTGLCQNQETLAASQRLAHLLSAEEHQQLCKIASNLLFTHLRHFWLPVAEDTGNLFKRQLAQLEAALIELAKRSRNASFTFPPQALPELDISKCINDVGLALGPSTSTFEDLYRLVEEWKIWKSYSDNTSLALDNPGLFVASDRDLIWGSFQSLYRVQGALHIIRSLREKLPKIAWYYQATYGESLDTALEAWIAGSAQQLASLQQLQDIGDQASNCTVNDQQSFRELLRTTLGFFDRPFHFVWQLWRGLTVCDSAPGIFTQQMLSELVQRLKQNFYSSPYRCHHQ